MVDVALHKLEFLTEGGEMGHLIRTKDWSATPLGVPAQWSPVLRTSLNTLLASPLPTAIAWGPHFLLLYNDAFQPLINTTAHAAAIGSPAANLLADQEAVVDTGLATVLQGTTITINNFMVPLAGTDQQQRYVLYCSPVREDAGAVAGVLITAIERPQKVTIDTDQPLPSPTGPDFSQMADTLPQIVWTATPDGIVNYYNRQWYRLIGTEGEMGDNNWDKFLHPDDHAFCIKTWSDSLQTGTPYEIEYRFYLKAPVNAYRWFLGRALPVRDAAGKIISWVGTCTDIDDVKQIEQSLRESEERFHSATNNTPVMMWMADAQGNCIFANKAWQQYTGLISEEVLGWEWLQSIHPEDRAASLAIYREAINKRQPFEIEHRLRRRDGEYRWILTQAMPRFLEAEFMGYIVSGVDVQERKLANEEAEKRILARTRELQMKNEELELQRGFADAILHSSIDAICVFDTSMRFVSFNKKCAELYGLTKDSIGKSIVELFPVTIGGLTVKSIERALQGEYVHNLSNPSQLLDRHFETFFIPLKKSNEIYGVLGIAHDNTAIIRANDKLLKSNQELALRNEQLKKIEERYLHMTNEVVDYAILLLNKEGYIENWNKGVENIKGYTAEEVIGKHFSIFYTPDDRTDRLPQRLLQEAVKNGKASGEGWRVRKDGTTFWGSIVLTAFHNQHNEVIGFSKVTRDLTERKLSEDQLKRYAARLEFKNKELEQINRELQSFTYVASHDLQEPLRKIRTFGNMIMERDIEHISETGRDYFNRMVNAASRMQNLINSLLEFSRTSTHNRVFEVTDLNVLIEEVRKELWELIDEKQAVVEITPLPVLKVVPFQFKQLWVNLIGNALKYTRPGVKPVISLSVQLLKPRQLRQPALMQGVEYYQFALHDNGIGFEQQYAAKIFELFQRLHGRSEYNGSGIGLAICKKIAENHYGFITAEGHPGNGATFYVYIPTDVDKVAG